MEEYAEPTTDDASVGEVAPGATDPGAPGGYEVVEPKPEGDYTVTDPGEGTEGEYVKPEPEDGGEGTGPEFEGGPVVVGEGTEGDPGAIEPRPGDTYEVVDSGTDGEYQVVTLTPEGGNETTDMGEGEVHRIIALACEGGLEPTSLVPEGEVEAMSLAPEGIFDILTPVSNQEKGLMLAQMLQSVTTTVGTSEQASELALASLNNLSWDIITEPTQTPSNTGGNLGTQMTAFTNPFQNVPNIAGEFGNAVSQISASAREAFTGFQIPDGANLLGNW